MHVRLASLVAVIAVLGAPTAHAAAPASVRMVSCTPWQEGTGGAVTYAARMDAVPGTARMSLRFRLFEKYGDGRFERVSGEGLGVWRKSRAGAAAFRYEHTVEGLRQGAVYRVVVHYRWRAAGGELIQTARRRSERCSQGGGLPNLRVASVETRRGEVEGTAVYKVKIVNDGAATARNVGVLLRVDGEVVDEAEVIEVLEPNETRTVKFNGPVCRSRMRIVVDPKELIPESRERDNVLGPTCL
jgi:hypothetical protein